MPEEFVPINSQEEFNKRLGDRIERVQKQYEKQIEDAKKFETQYNELKTKFDDLTQKSANHQKELDERDAKIKAYETNSVKMRIANELGLPYELANRLNGENEEDIRKDAETIKGFFNSPKTQPLASADREASKEGSKDAALINMLRKLDTK